MVNTDNLVLDQKMINTVAGAFIPLRVTEKHLERLSSPWLPGPSTASDALVLEGSPEGQGHP